MQTNNEAEQEFNTDEWITTGSWSSLMIPTASGVDASQDGEDINTTTFSRAVNRPKAMQILSHEIAEPLNTLRIESCDNATSSKIVDTGYPSNSAKILILKQPEEQHRARYLSEGSRGAIKDRTGSSHCTIQISGYFRPTRVEMFAANGTGSLEPHPLYKLIPVAGKTVVKTPCKKIVAHDGIECLEIKIRPETNMTAILDCMGILKICSYDSKQRRQTRPTTSKRQKSTSPTMQSKDSEVQCSNLSSTSTRICFRAYVPNESKNNYNVIQTCTEAIRCVQQLGVPEVLKMSLNSAPAVGGMDLFIIGRNFDRNTVVLFREYTDDGALCWTAEAPIAKPYFHQCHIVCTVPTYPNRYCGGTCSITVRCGSKFSHPTNFVYHPCEIESEDTEGEWVVPVPHASSQLAIPQRNRVTAWAPPISAFTSSYYCGLLNDDSPVNTSAMTKGSEAANHNDFYDFNPNFTTYNFNPHDGMQQQTSDSPLSQNSNELRRYAKRSRKGF
ncbi:hypothetical protein M3Y98_00624200 [Aphelenchoides besseyi]|nr:hypothetical protein M3Y98_00624200 [Aphelenchoides besseyi]KAI6208412.1 hypothetical protein M3Y96_00112300 [Aphelenchoides besseyi]